MSQKCESCSAPSDMYLCNRCVPDLRQLLASLVSCGTVTDEILQTVEVEPGVFEQQMVKRTRKLAGLLEYLRGYAVGQARRGEQARRVHHEPHSLNGDDSAASHIETLAGCNCPDGECTCNVSKAQDRRERDALNRALAAGGVNTSASELLAEMHYSLSSWAKGIASAHGMTLEWRTTTGFAHFLSQNVPKIARDADAGHFHHRVRAFVRRAERIINPPDEPRECGPCPTELTAEQARARLTEEQRRNNVDVKGRRRCATPLTADRAATEVTCPDCDTTHNIDKLIDDLWDDVDEWHLTRPELVELLKVLGTPLSSDTLKTWCNRGKKIGKPPVLQRLQPRGWRRSGETAGEWHATRESKADQPVYRLIDLRPFMPDKDKPKASATA